MRAKRSRKNRRRTKRKGGFKPAYLLVFLTVITLSCLYIWQRVTVVTLAGENKELRLKINEKQQIRKYLQIEVTKLNSVQRIEERGRRLGLVYPPLDGMGWIHESSDSVYLEHGGLTGKIWARLKNLHRDLLSGDEAVAREIEHEP